MGVLDPPFSTDVPLESSVTVSRGTLLPFASSSARRCIASTRSVVTSLRAPLCTRTCWAQIPGTRTTATGRLPPPPWLGDDDEPASFPAAVASVWCWWLGWSSGPSGANASLSKKVDHTASLLTSAKPSPRGGGSVVLNSMSQHGPVSPSPGLKFTCETSPTLRASSSLPCGAGEWAPCRSVAVVTCAPTAVKPPTLWAGLALLGGPSLLSSPSPAGHASSGTFPMAPKKVTLHARS
mmetsp:Transcript_42185/g.85318  ORF Transcript_42185/g.85318 Transcript_42185/m.85318 type:complete len:237 (-) Transcript_42185:4100-4810(-)